MIPALLTISLLLGWTGQPALAEDCPSSPTATPVGGHPIQYASASGAWFYKSESVSSQSWVGIRAEGRLPRISIDPSRQFTSARDYRAGPLDRPSVYLGGTVGGAEVDAGLSWDRVYSSDGQPVVPEKFLFRPFWRTSPKWGAPTEWNNPDIRSEKNIYFEPGEAIRMSIEVVSPAGLSPLQVALSICSQDAAAPRCFKTRFAHAGRPSKPSTFKRVNSIDQFRIDGKTGNRIGCEGESVVATQTTALDATWSSVTLLKRQRGSQLPIAVPMTASLQHTLVGREFKEMGQTVGIRTYFRDSPINSAGGLERISIVPSAKRN